MRKNISLEIIVNNIELIKVYTIVVKMFACYVNGGGNYFSHSNRKPDFYRPS